VIAEIVIVAVIVAFLPWVLRASIGVAQAICDGWCGLIDDVRSIIDAFWPKDPRA
jgi:hypothetical protein